MKLYLELLSATAQYIVSLLKIKLFPIVFLYRLVTCKSTQSNIMNNYHLISNQTFRYIVSTPICQLTKMNHGQFMQLMSMSTSDQFNEFEKEVSFAKLVYAQTLRNKQMTLRKFPDMKDIIEQQCAHHLANYMATQEQLEINLQAEIHAAAIPNYRDTLEKIYVESA